MFKKIILILPFLIDAVDNNNAQIPQAPSIIKLYEQEIRKLDMELDIIHSSPFEWEKFKSFHFFNFVIYPKSCKNVHTIDDVSPQETSEDQSKRLNELLKTENLETTYARKCQIHYELKSKFLKKCQENK